MLILYPCVSKQVLTCDHSFLGKTEDLSISFTHSYAFSLYLSHTHKQLIGVHVKMSDYIYIHMNIIKGNQGDFC